MNFLFDQEVFDTFKIETVEGRMDAIRSRIQPVFRHYAQEIENQFDSYNYPAMPIHVAKHLRRKVHPAKNTWVAIGGDKRGYKKYPHIELGINPEYVFIVLALISNPVHEKAIAKAYSQEISQFEKLPQDMIVIPDHTDLPYLNQTDANYATLFDRFAKVKKAEFMLGRLAKVGDPVLATEETTSQWIQQTITDVLPFFEIAIEFYQ